MKKLLSILVVLAMVLTCAPFAASAEVVPAQPAGDGTAAAPYQIGTAAELYWFAAQVNGGNVGINAVLTADITLNADLISKLNITTTQTYQYGKATVKSGQTVEAWTPIGNTAYPYTGAFDGNGKSISGMYINGSDNTYKNTGLFGYVGGGTVKNLTVKDSYHAAYSYMGGIVGYMTGGTVENCHYNNSWLKSQSGEMGGIVGGTKATEAAPVLIKGCTSDIVYYQYGSAGGIVGEAAAWTNVENCAFTGSMIGKDTNSGGIVGYITGGTVKNCVNSGSVTGSQATGGIVGKTYDAHILYCVNSGTVSNSNSKVGGIVGDVWGAAIVEYCANSGNVTNTGSASSYAGGIAGTLQNNGEESPVVRYSYNTGTIAGKSSVGGIAGHLQGSSTATATYMPEVYGCYNASAVTVTDKYAGGITGQMNYKASSHDNYYNSDLFSGDANGYKISGSGAAPTITNNVGMTGAAFASGEICYLLNGSTSQGTLVWYQTIGEDAYPTFDGGVVLYNAEENYYYNEGAAKPSTVTVAETVGGTVRADRAIAVEGKTVTLTVVPTGDYALEQLSVTYDGGAVEVIGGENGIYTFTMPAADVTVSATFKVKSVAQVDGTPYATFAEALDAWLQPTATQLTLLADVSHNGQLNLYSEDGTTKILDLNNRVLTITKGGLLVQAGVTLTIQDSGEAGEIKGLSDYYDLVVCYDGAELNVTGGKLSGNTNGNGITVFEDGVLNLGGDAVVVGNGMAAAITAIGNVNISGTPALIGGDWGELYLNSDSVITITSTSADGWRLNNYQSGGVILGGNLNLPEGYCLMDAPENGKYVASPAEEQIVYIVQHTHTYADGKCTCGAEQLRLAIDSIYLRPGCAGVYYGATFRIAADTKVVRKGIVVSLYNQQPVADGTDDSCLWTTGTTSVVISDILEEGAGYSSNKSRATMPIYARAYVELEDGTYVYSDAVGMHLQQVTEAADAMWDDLEETQITELTALYGKFENVMRNWNIPNIKAAVR